MKLIAASIVLFNNESTQLNRLIDDIFNQDANIELYIIDNSPTKALSGLFQDTKCLYIHNPSNPGFGASHNLAIDLAIKSGSKYHFIINPDIYLKMEVIMPMVNYMKAYEDIGMMMPQILNENGSIQYLPKLLPNPFWIIKRKIKIPLISGKKFIENYELHSFTMMNKIYNVPIISGCFSLLNLEAIKKIGSYDDKYFMYFEDFDLSRRMHEKYKTLYFPAVSVYHGYEGGANKSFKLFKIFIRSAITYFNKWGWFFDKKRKVVNAKTLAQFNLWR